MDNNMNNLIYVILGITALASVIGIINHLIMRPINRKLKALFEQTSPLADVRSKCMIRESSQEEPGSAQVLEGELWISTVTGKNLCIPLPQIKLTKVRRKNIFGNMGWFWKTIFYLDTPRTSGLRIGVDNPEQWERVLKQSVS
jgi:hypothetical protein